MNAASHRFADAVRAGRAEFRTGLVEDLPLPDSTFDKALSVPQCTSGKAFELDPQSSIASSNQAVASCLASSRRRIWTG
ncbi:hypothetical protein [Mesorhizobium sp. LNJC398B00]|uniref:hypothetical protein n=1 Tax=Mesorhizobium sp. LNJC398B00 TaxID=1287276 RepID=UPI0040379DB3